MSLVVALHDGIEERLLAVVVVEDERLVDLSALGDVSNADAVKAHRAEERICGS